MVERNSDHHTSYVLKNLHDCYTYVEYSSKDRAGGLAQIRIDNKYVPCYAVPDKNPACLVYLLDIYLNKLPQYAFTNDVLYCRPKPKTPVDASSPWFDAASVGRNELAKMVKEMCCEAGIPPQTNHSL